MGFWSRIKKECMSRLSIADNIKCNQLAAKYAIDGGYKRIYHYHIRKTGGTSINMMFLSLGGEGGDKVYSKLLKSPIHRNVSGDKIFVGWHKRLINKGHFFYAYSHIPAHYLRLPQDTFTITCLRDPVKRVISHYKMILEYKTTGKIPKAEVKWLGNSFEDFLYNIPKEHLLNQLYMFSRSYSVDEAYERIINCSHYLLSDDFAHGVDTLSAKLGIKLEAIHVRKSAIEVTIDPKNLKLLRSMLEEEIQLYEKLKDRLNAQKSKQISS